MGNQLTKKTEGFLLHPNLDEWLHSIDRITYKQSFILKKNNNKKQENQVSGGKLTSECQRLLALQRYRRESLHVIFHFNM